MTKLDYGKSPEPDPARVVEVRDSGVWAGNDAHPFETAAQRRERRSSERAASAARGEKIRYNAIIKKFGMGRAVDYGVPREFVAAKIRAHERELKARERNKLRKERRAAARADERKLKS